MLQPIDGTKHNKSLTIGKSIFLLQNLYFFRNVLTNFQSNETLFSISIVRTGTFLLNKIKFFTRFENGKPAVNTLA